jgi:UDP-N-acetylmuramoyl-L-alanyl-D-glutamate--2,6-diaminopimelate ligase
LTEVRKNKIQQALKQIGAQVEATNLLELDFDGIAYNSAEVKKNYAFFAIAGYKLDGKQFIGDAITRGASCIFTEERQDGLKVPQIIIKDARFALAHIAAAFYDNPSEKLRLIGVTGTNGKTTTTHLVEHILSSHGLKVGLIGTLGARQQSTDTYTDIKRTTPESADLQRLISEMQKSGCTHIAMEVASHALSLKRVTACNFAQAALTNISQDHLDFHKTMDNYWQAKRILFAELNSSCHQQKYAVVNQDDPLFNEFVKVSGNTVAVVTYGWHRTAQISVKNYTLEAGLSKLTLETPQGELDLSIKLAGRFNVYNIMAAVAIALNEKVPLSTISKSLQTFPGVSGRFEIVSTGEKNEPLCIVDYAHTPDGLDNVLKTAAELVKAPGKLIVVFGCGGDRDTSKRPQMGEIAELRANEIIVTSDNPRSEEPEVIIANILAGIKRTKDVTVEPNRAQAIKTAVSNASQSDIVVIAGKGHETYQIIGSETIHFDDREEVLNALRLRLSLKP